MQAVSLSLYTFVYVYPDDGEHWHVVVVVVGGGGGGGGGGGVVLGESGAYGSHAASRDRDRGGIKKEEKRV